MYQIIIPKILVILAEGFWYVYLSVEDEFENTVYFIDSYAISETILDHMCNLKNVNLNSFKDCTLFEIKVRN